MTTTPKITLRQTVAMPIGPTDIAAHFASFDGLDPAHEHFAVLLGPTDGVTPLVRIHSECVTGDTFGSQRCDCGAQLQEAIARCANDGGIIIYLRQEGRGIGLNAKLDAYQAQAAGANTFEANVQNGHPADARDYSAAIGILHALGVSKCRLLTNNPAKAAAVRESGIDLVEIVPTGVHLTPHNAKYLHDKAELADHNIRFEQSD